MKREIKFRGKRVDNKEWVEGGFGILGEDTDLEKSVIIVSTLYTNSYVDRFYFTDVEVTRESVGQFTGLKDKNGVEIYEGDILKTECGNIAEVKFDHIYCSFGIIKNGWAFFHYFHEAVEAKACEVIGNIHDNPELLK